MNDKNKAQLSALTGEPVDRENRQIFNGMKVIEAELVTVYETSTGEKVVYGTELHEKLMVKTPYRTWIERRFAECEAVENEDYTSVQICTVAGGTPKKDNIIKLDTAKEMAMLERNDKGKEVRRYFIKIEKKYKGQIADTENLPPELQMFKSILDAQTKQYMETQELKGRVEQAEAKVDSIKDVVALNTVNWRDDTGKMLRNISQKMGGGSAYSEIRTESYTSLEHRFGVNLKQRLTNKRRRMLEEGSRKSQVDKLSYLDVIAEDKKLIEGYVAIVKEMAIKYGVA